MIIATPSPSRKSYVKHLSGPLPAKISNHLFFVITDTSITLGEMSFMLVTNDQILQEKLHYPWIHPGLAFTSIVAVFYVPVIVHHCCIFCNNRFSLSLQLSEELRAVSKKLDQNKLEGDSKPQRNLPPLWARAVYRAAATLTHHVLVAMKSLNFFKIPCNCLNFLSVAIIAKENFIMHLNPHLSFSNMFTWKSDKLNN